MAITLMIKTFKKSFIKNASHTDIPRLLEPLKRGEADLMLGSRFKGEIKKGAMPWHHQYIGNPFLTWLFNKANVFDGMFKFASIKKA